MNEEEMDSLRYNKHQARAIERLLVKLQYVRSINSDLSEDIEYISEHDSEFDFCGWLRVNDYTFLRMFQFEADNLASIKKEIEEQEGKEQKRISKQLKI